MSLKLIGRKYIGFEKALARQAQAFAAVGGAEIELKFLEVEDLYERMVAGKGAANGEADIMLTVTDWYPALIAENAVARLDEFIATDPPQDWNDGWTPSVLGLQQDAGGHIYGLPYHDGPEMFIFRKDLFDSDDEQKCFQEQHGRPLTLPVTWSEFLEVARFFTRPDDNLYGTVFAAFPDAHNIIYDFLLHVWTRGGEILDGDNRPAFHSKIGIEALSFIKDLMHTHQVTPPDCAEIDSVKSSDRFASGGIAMMVNWMGFAAYADSYETSQVKGKVGCGLVPAGNSPGGTHCSLNIYWCLTITAGSQQKEAAYRFLKNCAMPENDIITSDEGGIGVRRSTWLEYANRGVAGYAELEEQHAHAMHLPQVAAFGQMIEILNEHLDRALNHDGDPAAELNAAAEKCVKLLE